MTLGDWLKRTRTRQYVFARRIGVSPSMVSGWCKGTVWPEKHRIEAIVRETQGAVTPNDLLSVESRGLIDAAQLQSATDAYREPAEVAP